jgi:hypothetical protein
LGYSCACGMRKKAVRDDTNPTHPCMYVHLGAGAAARRWAVYLAQKWRFAMTNPLPRIKMQCSMCGVDILRTASRSGQVNYCPTCREISKGRIAETVNYMASVAHRSRPCIKYRCVWHPPGVTPSWVGMRRTLDDWTLLGGDGWIYQRSGDSGGYVVIVDGRECPTEYTPPLRTAACTETIRAGGGVRATKIG